MKKFNHVTNVPKLDELQTEQTDGKRLYITPYGRFPSVTTVLGSTPKQGIIDWRNNVGEKEADRASTHAKLRGTRYHKMLEKYLNNDHSFMQGIMPDMKQAFRDSKSIIDRIDNIRYNECSLYSKSLSLAGRTDVIADFDGVFSVIDFKTSNREKSKDQITDYFEQGTAYSLMLEELTNLVAEQVVIIILCDDLLVPSVFKINRNDYQQSLTTKVMRYHGAVY